MTSIIITSICAAGGAGTSSGTREAPLGQGEAQLRAELLITMIIVIFVVVTITIIVIIIVIITNLGQKGGAMQRHRGNCAGSGTVAA